jgi:hypothetical protein
VVAANSIDVIFAVIFVALFAALFAALFTALFTALTMHWGITPLPG